MSYTAFVINEIDRQRLLERYKPIFPDVIAHHVTFKMGEHPELLIHEPLVVINGVLVNDRVQTLLVSVDGRNLRNHDPGKYHITWSINRSKGAKPVDSNELIKHHWEERQLLVPCIVRGQMMICD